MAAETDGLRVEAPWTRATRHPIFQVQEGFPLNDRKDEEENRLSARAARYVRVGTNVGAVAARVAGQRLFGFDCDDSKNAAALAAALGGLKGPIMKVAQLLATIPEALPAEYAQELSQLQSQAPPMGPAFVRRRMMAELGPEWAARFKSFEPQPAASASLGQVHRAVGARRHARWPPSCSIPTCSRPWRRTSTSSRSCSRCTRA